MKILIVTHLYLFPDHNIKRGGIHIHNSLLNLRSAGFQINVVFFIPWRLEYLKYFVWNWRKLSFRSYLVDDIEVVPCLYFPRLSRRFPRFDALLKSYVYRRKNLACPDVVFSQSLFPDGPPASQIALFLGRPLFNIMRGSDVHSFAKSIGKVKTVVQEALELSDLVLSVSENLAQQAQSVFQYNYVDRILYTTCSIDLFKRRSLHENNLTRWIFVGAVYYKKGIFELLEAFVNLVQQGYSLELSVVGDGPDMIEFREKVVLGNVSDMVQLHGQISDRRKIAELLNVSDLMVFPSYNEGLPNCIVEAVASELVVITSNVGGVAEIAPGKKSFRIMEGHSPGIIERTYKDLIQQNRADIKKDLKANRKFVINRFSPEAQTSNFKEIFKI